MRVLAAVLLILALIAAMIYGTRPVEAKGEPFAVFQTTGYQGSGCYADDLTLSVKAQGYLPAGRWEFTSPLPICDDKIVRGSLESDRRAGASLTVIDGVGDGHPGRESVVKPARGGPVLVRQACNSDSKTDTQLQVEDPWLPARWIVDVETPGFYRLEAIAGEPWYESESGYGYCGHTP